ncbi:MAG TPA: glycosyltransferase family 2 protein [Jatrophihabitans sp.]|uniref:glycosyltransferase family 2 protein n=1 Tax=Jatrophihabitans sp. TaxID=1932789 RepID=UPI002F037BE2
MSVLFRAVLGFLLVKLTTLAMNLAWFPVLGKGRSASGQLGSPHDPGSPHGTVSLLVPMRDEAVTLMRFLPALLNQSGVTELIVLDDQSGDGSAALARSIMAGSAHARLVSGTPPPPGWVGKTWACEQLAAEASGELLVYCDADVLLAPGAIEAVLRAMAEQRADVFSVFPRQLTGSLGEALLTPLIEDVLLCFLPFRLLSVDVPAAATANGALLVFRRPALDQLAGFSSVRSEIVEDVALARRTRRAGLRLGLALGGDLVQTRMYTSYRQVVAGLGKGLLAVTGGSRWRLVAAAGWHLAAYTLPLVAASQRRRWLLPFGLGLAERLLVGLKCHPRAAWQAGLTPLSPIAFLPVAIQAMRRQQSWKGRSYP